MKRKEIAFSNGKEYTLGLEGRSGMRRWKEKFIGVCVAVKLNYFNFLSFSSSCSPSAPLFFLLWRICGDILYIFFFFASLQHAATFQTSSKALSGTLKTIFFSYTFLLCWEIKWKFSFLRKQVKYLSLSKQQTRNIIYDSLTIWTITESGIAVNVVECDDDDASNVAGAPVSVGEMRASFSFKFNVSIANSGSCSYKYNFHCHCSRRVSIRVDLLCLHLSSRFPDLCRLSESRNLLSSNCETLYRWWHTQVDEP